MEQENAMPISGIRIVPYVFRALRVHNVYIRTTEMHEKFEFSYSSAHNL